VSITLVTGPANAGKAEVVIDAVRRHIAHRSEPLLVVPTRADVEYYLRELAGSEAAMGVRVIVFDDLVGELVRRAGVLEPVLGELARERLIGALASVPAASQPGVRRALGELFSRLQVGRVAPQRLAAALDAGLGDAGAALGLDLAAAYGEYLRRLRTLGRLDSDQRAIKALDALREQPSRWGRPPAPVLFYGFDDLTPLQLDVIETLGAVVDTEVTVSLAYEPGRIAFAGRAGTFQTLSPLASEHRSLPARADHYAEGSRAALSHLERNLFEPGAQRRDAGPVVELLQGGGERAELELVAARVAGLLAGGTPAEEVAVLVRRPAASAALVDEVFSAASVPFAMPVKRPLGDTAVGRALIGLLRCVPRPDAPAPGTPADLLAWLRAPGRLQRPELADRLELDVRREGLRSVAQARERWEQSAFPLETIDRLADAQRRGPAALAELAGRELVRLFAAPRRGRADLLGHDEMDEARALAGGRAALSELRELAGFAADAAPADAAELATVLSAVEVNSGDLPGPGLVAVLDPLQLRARRVRALFVCGLQEGEFPLRERPEPLLGERDRARVAQASGLLLGEAGDALAAERYLLYAVLSRPEQQLTLSWHETDDEASPLSRSLFVDDVCDLFGESLFEGRERRALGALDPSRRTPAAAGPAGLAAAGRLTDERVLAALRERVWSGTSIEKWLDCPVSWFVERLLAPERFEPEPEPLVRGGLAHAALKDTLDGLRRETGSARVTPATLGRARELMRAALAAADADASQRLSVSPEREAAIVRSLRADLERYLEHAAGLEGSLVPRELELGFGFDDPGQDDHGEPSELPAFELGGGVRMRGRIDRIDVGADGAAVVIDYKARSAPAGDKWLSDRKLQVALYMQAAEQLLGVRVVGGLYQPLSGRDPRARGVLLDDHDAADGCVRTDRIDPEALAELLGAALDAARAAAGEAGRGELEPRPETCGFRGGGCRHPTICRCER
jgi:ATP-dependent helicase/DNAse subunit B